MRNSNIVAAILTTVSLIAVAPASAKSSVPREPEFTLDYHLPEVKIGFAVSHMITACPAADGKGFAMDTVTAVKPVYERGAKIRIDPKGKLFVDREVKLEFHDNGTLKSFNGSSKGQGGKIVAAAIKAASFATTAVLGVPLPVGLAVDGQPKPRDPLVCKEAIAILVARKDELKSTLVRLRKELVQSGPSDNLLLQITRHEAELADTLESLTISSKPEVWTPKADGAALPPSPAPPDLSAWFENVDQASLQEALKAIGLGQMLNFVATAKFITKPDASSTDNGGKPYRALVYREPGLIEVSLNPREPFDRGELTPSEAIKAKKAYNDTKVNATVRVPQIGKLKIISFDGSGIFGSRAVAATFNEKGDLTSIGYTSTGGADALAGVIDASVAAATELRDRETNALKREVERRTQANALEALIEAEAKAKKDKEEAAAAAGS